MSRSGSGHLHQLVAHVSTVGRLDAQQGHEACDQPLERGHVRKAVGAARLGESEAQVSKLARW